MAVPGARLDVPAALHHQHGERRAACRQLADAALESVLPAAPFVAAASGAAAAALVDVWPWAGIAALASLGWLALAALAHVARDTRCLRMGVFMLTVMHASTLAALPWTGADASSAGWCSALLAATAIAGAAAFAPMWPAAALFAALPMSAAALSWQWHVDAGLAAGAVLASLVAALLAWHGRRVHRAASLSLIDRARRLRELEFQRDAAVRTDRDKSRFLAIASHDLRQPVHALGLFAATLETRLHGSSDEPLARNMMRAIEGLERSFNAMLDISRLDAGTIEPNIQHFPLRDVFRRLHMHFAGQAELTNLSLRFSPGGKSVDSDAQLLERVLGNLIQNAIKYTRKGGIVVVARSTAARVNVEVWDTGVGIAPNELPRVFDEFYQVGRGERDRTRGLGIGLAIVKRLVQLMGHTLSVSSQPGKGTVFRIGITLSGLAEIQDATAAADTVPMPLLHPRTVLVIEDEEAIREGLSILLEEWGYQPAAVATLDDAERAAQALQGHVDLILSDLHLGDGPDGIDAIRAVRRRCAVEVPAILITGDTSPAQLRRARDSGHMVLFKPLQPRKLYNVLRGMVP